jgi:hypothetical protein
MQVLVIVMQFDELPGILPYIYEEQQESSNLLNVYRVNKIDKNFLLARGRQLH